MPTFRVTDPHTGRTVRLMGDSPPTEAELEQVFKALPPAGQPAPQAQEGGFRLPDAVMAALKATPFGMAYQGAKAAPDFAHGMTTNEPTRGFAGDVGRAVIPGATGALASPLGPVGIGLATAGGEGVRQGLVGLRAAVEGKETPSLGTVAKDMGLAGAGGLVGEGVARGGIAVAKGTFGFLKNRITPVMLQLFDVPMDATRRVLNEGADKVLTPYNMNPNVERGMLERAQNALNTNLAQAGELVGAAEKAIELSGDGARLFDTGPVGMKLRDAAQKLKGAVATPAQKADIAELERIAGLLESGPVSGRDMIRNRRLMDDMVTYRQGEAPKVGAQTERVLKEAIADIRGTINNAYPALGKANAHFHRASEAYDQWRELLDDKGRLFGEPETVGRVRAAFMKGKKYQRIMATFDHEIANGQKFMDEFFDNIAAREFAPDVYDTKSPSGTVFRGLKGAGITAPEVGGRLLKAGSKAAAKVQKAGKAAEAPTRAAFRIGGQELGRALGQ